MIKSYVISSIKTLIYDLIDNFDGQVTSFMDRILFSPIVLFQFVYCPHLNL